MARPLWDRMPGFIRDYKLTTSFLAFLVVLSFLQALFNFRESPKQYAAHIVSSHEMEDPSLTSDGILDGTTIWHAPAKFPQWVQFWFPEAVKIDRLEMMSQANSPNGREFTRSPKTFSFYGSDDKKDWRELLHVKKADYETGGQWKAWDVESDKGYQYFRLVITANNGDPNLVTIHRMNFRFQ